jgi:hypothetical protein
MKPHLRIRHPGHRGRALLRRALDEPFAQPRKMESGKRDDAAQAVSQPHFLAHLAALARRFMLS